MPTAGSTWRDVSARLYTRLPTHLAVWMRPRGPSQCTFDIPSQPASIFSPLPRRCGVNLPDAFLLYPHLILICHIAILESAICPR